MGAVVDGDHFGRAKRDPFTAFKASQLATANSLTELSSSGTAKPRASGLGSSMSAAAVPWRSITLILYSLKISKITCGGAWLAQRNDRAWHRSHPCCFKYDFAQLLYRFIQTHGPSIAAADSLPQSTKDEAASALRQWNQSLMDLGYTRVNLQQILGTGL